MGSRAQSTLPVIEFNEKNMNPGTSSWKSTSDSVRQALETYGCFVLGYDNNISSELYEETFGLTAELFGLTMETKRRYTSEMIGFGYGENPSYMPLFENFGIEDAGNLEAAGKFTRLMWPDGHYKFCETKYSYCKVLLELDDTVMKMVGSSYNLENYMNPLIQSSFYMTKLVKYHSPGENKTNIGLLPHRDKSFMGVISTNEVKGLEIQTRDGDWIDYEPSPGKFIVIVGEALMTWTNGWLHAPCHRVMMTGDEVRYTIALFWVPKSGYIIKVPEELVDEDHLLLFKPYDPIPSLEDYCGA